MAKGNWRDKPKGPGRKDKESASKEECDSYEVEYCLRSLKGGWKDTRGSHYDVSIINGAVEIKTTRPGGQVIETKVVRWDPKTDWIVWGRSGVRSQYWLSELTSNYMLWERENAKAFSWTRVSGSPEPDDEDENEEDELEEEEEDADFEVKQSRGKSRRESWQERARLRRQVRDKRKVESLEETTKTREEEVEEGYAEDACNEEEVTPAAQFAHDLKKMLGVTVRIAASQQAEAAAPLPMPRVVDQVALHKATEDPGVAEAKLLAALRMGGAAVDETHATTPGDTASLLPAGARIPASPPSATNGDKTVQHQEMSAYMGHLESVVQTFLGGMQFQAGVDLLGGMQLQAGVDHELLMGRIVGPEGATIGLPNYLSMGSTHWPVDPQQMRLQLEYYFSDENLFHDAYLKGFMMPDEGWVSLVLVQSFPRMRNLHADLVALRQAVTVSETLEIDGTELFVRIKDPYRRQRWSRTTYH